MKDWLPPDPRETRRIKIEAAVLTAIGAIIALGWLSHWLRG